MEILESERAGHGSLIWNTAGDYSFEPNFKAYDAEGRADLYWNSIIGAAPPDLRSRPHCGISLPPFTAARMRPCTNSWSAGTGKRRLSAGSTSAARPADTPAAVCPLGAVSVRQSAADRSDGHSGTGPFLQSGGPDACTVFPGGGNAAGSGILHCSGCRTASSAGADVSQPVLWLCPR